MARNQGRFSPGAAAFADHIIDNNGPVEDTVRQIMEVMG